MQIAGEWGWRRRLRLEGRTTGAVADASVGEVAVPSGSSATAGQTLLIDEEQIYVRETASGTLKVDRGVNGTAATAHDAGSAVYVFEYPAPVVEAALLQTVRLWRLTGAGGESEGRAVLDADVRTMLASYRKTALGVKGGVRLGHVAEQKCTSRWSVFSEKCPPAIGIVGSPQWRRGWWSLGARGIAG